MWSPGPSRPRRICCAGTWRSGGTGRGGGCRPNEAGISTTNPIGRTKPGSIGVPLPQNEVKLSRSELWWRSRGILGNATSPEKKKTAETLRDGGLHTGDVGPASTMRAIYTSPDRMKDIIITAGGKNITQSEMREPAEVSPYSTDAVRDRRPAHLTALVMSTTRTWEIRQDQSFRSPTT